MKELLTKHHDVFENEYESDFILMAAYLMKESLDDGSWWKPYLEVMSPA